MDWGRVMLKSRSEIFSTKVMMVVGFAVSLTAGTANAAIVDVTYTGVVDNGIDYLGLFGPAGASLVGKSATTTYEYVTSQQGSYITKNQYTSGSTYVLYKGDLFPSPYISSSETINGITQNTLAFIDQNDYLTSGFNSTQNYRQDFTKESYIDASGSGFVNRISTQVGVDRSPGHVFPLYVNEPESFIFNQQDTSETEFNFNTIVNIPANTAPYNLTKAIYSNVTTRLFIKQYSFNQTVEFPDGSPAPFFMPGASVSAVPEPSTWAMILLGMAGLAGYGYTRRRNTESGTMIAA